MSRERPWLLDKVPPYQGEGEGAQYGARIESNILREPAAGIDLWSSLFAKIIPSFPQHTGLTLNLRYTLKNGKSSEFMCFVMLNLIHYRPVISYMTLFTIFHAQVCLISKDPFSIFQLRSQL